MWVIVMLGNIVLGIGIILTIFLYFSLVICYIVNRNSCGNVTGSELGLKILDNEYSINLIKSKESIFSKYSIKRRMVKLSSNTYDSNNYFSLAISSLLAGYSIITNKLLDFIGKIFKEIKFVSFSSVVVVVASGFTRSVGDAKICMVVLVLIAIYQYILNNINVEAIEKIDSKDEKINKILKLFTITTMMSFIITLTQILRLVIIILEI